MQIVAISDTHGKHRQVTLQPGEVLVHTGDLTINGDKSLIMDFVTWFAEQPFKHKIFIAGNHDRWAEQSHDELALAAREAGVHYLLCSGVVLDGVRFWGSPYTPEFMNWSFMLPKGTAASEHWQQIPANIDVLLTHGPPAGILDEVEQSGGGEGTESFGVGCNELRSRVDDIGVPLHVFGHIHESYGEHTHAGTRFVNASLLNNRYQLVNLPWSAELDFTIARTASTVGAQSGSPGSRDNAELDAADPTYSGATSW